ncbi:putative BOI-related E3 ubiquitin-protein ligase 3 [Heracleum sosnowskyi]|uniref:BOI-related E3 ubiquitin-protein ligase 3 n=1 Tax=Heracleum sosnowskyi TaxID=360622 RepID=A0AAD8MCI5_9APIA|nr:putative BOI-related E3 ubiquitin-protein ligase 3 [Heracleum sosnowskyi]
MAVEAKHFNPFHPQFVHNNRQLMNGIDEHINMYGGLLPPSGSTTETFLPVHYGTSVADSFSIKPVQLHTDSDLVHTLPVSRKRSRGDSIYQYQQFQNQLNNFSFLDEDISFLIQYQQFEIQNFIAQHTEKIRSEIEEHRKPSSRRIIAAVEDVIVKKLKAKQEELDKTVKLNSALQEKVKSLCIENQIWRDLANSTEATANALRTNLQQVLRHREMSAEVSEDAQSCCDSNAEDDGEEEESNGVSKEGRWCKKCGKEESCVLLLPCRHLCVCRVCELSVSVCPVCRSAKNASLVVNMF